MAINTDFFLDHMTNISLIHYWFFSCFGQIWEYFDQGKFHISKTIVLLVQCYAIITWLILSIVFEIDGIKLYWIVL